ncbi:Zn(2)-C6 fungal-type DNA-binding domain protein [Metarhizium album ARSEF 1941]|uniref:Zn(2)-C6 fungal-type DNA-binding domain protein n=1 Tax=Metarhizium album (strain ARSEF 1941) TaxID=1081103 RepID=A0A0B2WJT9_METAS|nr:Zn(2)-C6 fungal-type DNA-binding domain protein [Metarhizium album ARSEF 1941]KHN93974.1 Zn(2)-C6 fungal-type DNA-binding domain protein [Metarhizium album ARSEF 1941]
MSTAKATKKSAFSCELCRRRKVKCGGEQPICQRCAARNDDCVYKLNPTLSYTQRLEERIKELEDQVSNLAKSPSSLAGSPHSSPPGSGVQDVPSQTTRHATDEQGICRRFKSLKIDEKGSITYHGATSFFNLPSDLTGTGVSDTPILNPSSSDTDLQRRERLIHNAWHQRAMENLSEIPPVMMSGPTYNQSY